MTIEQILFCSLSYATGIRWDSLKKSRASTIRIWCVNRHASTVMRQSMNWPLNIRYSLCIFTNGAMKLQAILLTLNENVAAAASKGRFIVGRASAARRPTAADLASDRSDHHFDASAACV